jgi:hypothetical protein
VRVVREALPAQRNRQTSSVLQASVSAAAYRDQATLCPTCGSLIHISPDLAALNPPEGL